MIRNRYEIQRDERSVATALSHVLSIAITTLLILALVASATGFLDTHKQRAASDELRTIGNRLAGELASADGVGRNGQNVTVTTRYPDTVAGSTYSVALRNGTSACGALSNSTTFTCLELETSRSGASEIVPVHNETNLGLEAAANGRFVITSSGGSGSSQADPRGLELSPRVGIGKEVGSSARVSTGPSIAQKPIPDFVVNPGIPQTNSDVEFDGTLSQDPDDSIATYEWDVDGDGNFETTGPKPTWNYSNAGEKTVTLRVTDQSGLSASKDKAIHVAGLEYNEDIQTTASGDGVTFTVTNEHFQPIHLERILIDPEDPNLDRLSENEPNNCYWFGCVEDGSTATPSEVEVRNMSTGSVDGFVDWEAHSSQLSIPEGGVIVVLDEDGDANGDTVTLGPDDTARVTLKEFTIGPSPSGETFTFGLRYEVGSTVGSNAFNVTAP